MFFFWDSFSGAGAYETLKSVKTKCIFLSLICVFGSFLDPTDSSSFQRARFWVKELQNCEEVCQLFGGWCARTVFDRFFLTVSSTVRSTCAAPKATWSKETEVFVRSTIMTLRTLLKVTTEVIPAVSVGKRAEIIYKKMTSGLANRTEQVVKCHRLQNVSCAGTSWMTHFVSLPSAEIGAQHFETSSKTGSNVGESRRACVNLVIVCQRILTWRAEWKRAHFYDRRSRLRWNGTPRRRSAPMQTLDEIIQDWKWRSKPLTAADELFQKVAEDYNNATFQYMTGEFSRR